MRRLSSPARLALALLAGPLLSCALAAALARHWPDADGLNRLYRGLFAGTAFQAVWMAACLLAPRPGGEPWRRLVSATHVWAGAVVGAMLFLICLTGTLALFKPELLHWERTAQQRLPAVGTDVDAWVLAAQARHPDAAALTLSWPDPLSRQALVRAGSDPRRIGAMPLRADGMPSEPLAPGAATSLLVELHRNLHMGFPGRIAVSLFGFALLLLIATGLILHPRRRATALRLRLGNRLPVIARDTHLLAGLWLFPAMVLIAVTGVFSGLGALGTVTLASQAFPEAPRQAMRELMPSYRLASSGRDAPMPPLSGIVDRHLAAHPGFAMAQASLHHWGDANAYVTITGVRRWQLSTPLFEQFHYRAVDGALLQHDTAGRQGAWTQAFVAIQPLHFAAYAGNTSRWLHAAAGLAATLLCASGLYLWLKRTPPHAPSAALRLLANACLGLVTACCALWAAAGLIPADADGRADGLAWTFWSVWAALAASALLPARLRPAASTVLTSCAALLAAAVMAALPRWPQADPASRPALAGTALAMLLAGLLLWHLARRLRASSPNP